jgi:hypothetical protein
MGPASWLGGVWLMMVQGEKLDMVTSADVLDMFFVSCVNGVLFT